MWMKHKSAHTWLHSYSRNVLFALCEREAVQMLYLSHNISLIKIWNSTCDIYTIFPHPQIINVTWHSLTTLNTGCIKHASTYLITCILSPTFFRNITLFDVYIDNDDEALRQLLIMASINNNWERERGGGEREKFKLILIHNVWLSK